MILDSEKLEKNALMLLKKFSEAKLILQKADGKRDYQQIAKGLNIHPKTVSPALSLAKDLGFAERIKPGIYKKITSNMKYIPRIKQKTQQEDTSKIIRKFDKNITKSKIPMAKSSIKIDTTKASKMMGAYAWLYLIENTFRDLTRKVFTNEKDWWEKRVNSSIQNDVKENISKDKYYSPKRTDELDYTHLGQLMEIIVSKNNWKNFLPFLKEQEKNTFKVLFGRVIPFRNAIGHCIPLKEEHYKSIEVKFKEILEMLK